jgi:hypothetical protein
VLGQSPTFLVASAPAFAALFAVFDAEVRVALALLRAGLFFADDVARLAVFLAVLLAVFLAVFLAVLLAVVVVVEAVLLACVLVVFALAVVVFADETAARVDC